MTNVLDQIYYRSTAFLKNNSSTILSGLAVVGVVGTAVMVARATPKAVEKLNNAKAEKGEELTKLEAVVVAGPAYIPVLAVGASTIACIVGANILNKRQQASLASAYVLIENSYKNYRNKAKEIYGEDADTRIRDSIVIDERNGKTACAPWVSGPDLSGDRILFYDEFGHRFFEATVPEVLNAEYHVNRQMAISGVVSVNEFYEYLGLETNSFADAVSWWYDEFLESGLMPWVDFNHRPVKIEDGRDAGLEYISIRFVDEPTVNYSPD